MYSNEELYHYGVKGMKWGVIRKQDNPAKTEYRNARKNFIKVSNETRNRSGLDFGIKGIQRKASAQRKVHNAENKMIDAKAKYKASKAKTPEKAAKAEFNTYRRAMQKTGIRGSYADITNNNRSTVLYNHLKVTKGREYADRVEKRVQNVAIAKFATAASVGIGMTFVELYNKH